MAKAMRHRRPTCEPYFYGLRTQSGACVEYRIPEEGEIEVVWCGMDLEAHSASRLVWGLELDVNVGEILARLIFKRLGVWDGYTKRDWPNITRLLLWECGDEWQLTRSEAIRVWRDAHGERPHVANVVI